MLNFAPEACGVASRCVELLGKASSLAWMQIRAACCVNPYMPEGAVAKGLGGVFRESTR